MPFHVGTDAHFHQNQLLSARLEALAGLPPTPRQGRVFYVSGGLAGYDGVSFTGRLGMALVQGATALSEYRLWGGLNQNESVVGLWTFCPSQTGSTAIGLNTLPPTPSPPQAIGTLKPFILSGQSRLSTGYETTPDTDGAGDLAQPSTGLKRYVPNWVQHLGADLVDGYHATVNVTAYGIPVRVTDGHLRVPLDPTQVDHAPSRQYVDRRHAQMRVRTAVRVRTTGPLPAYTVSGGFVYQAVANGALVVDGITLVLGDRVMVANEADATRNWIFELLIQGSAGTKWALGVVGDLAGNGGTDPDNLGTYDYGDTFQVTAGATYAGTNWVMSGSPTAGGGGQPPPGEEVFFNLMQVSATITGGHGITVTTGKIHFWKSLYLAAELNTFPYFLANVDGQGALGNMGMYGSSGTYALKGILANALPKRASDAGAVFQESTLVENGTSVHSDLGRTLGNSAKPWTELWAQAGGAGFKLSNVYGSISTTQLLARSWTGFVADLTGDLNLGQFALKATTLTINGSAGIVVTGGTQDLSANRTWTVALGVIPAGSVTLPAGAVGYGNASNQLYGDPSQFFFNGTYAGLASKLNLGSVSAGTHRLEFVPGSGTVAPIRFTSPSVLLTVPSAGVFETDLSPAIKRARLFYTDSVPVRRPLAYYDDVNFTNDPVSKPNGGVGFYGGPGSNFFISKLDGEVLGTGDFAIFIRFAFPATTAAQINYGLFSLTSSTAGGTGPYDVLGFLTGTLGSPELRLMIRNAAGATGATWTFTDTTRVAGRVIDLLFSRVAGVVTIYVDGVNVTPVPSNGSFQSSPVANAAATLRFHLGNTDTASETAHTDFYRTAVFNRGFATEAEAIGLTRTGIAAADLWGSSTDLLAGAGSFETLTGWALTQPAGSSITLVTTGTLIQSGSAALRLQGPADGSYTAVSRSGVLMTPGKRLRYEMWARKDAASADPTSVQTTYGGTGFVKSVQVTGTYAFYTTEAVVEQPAPNPTFARTSGQTSRTFYVDAAFVRQVGALADFDLGIGRGTVVPDRSSRYPAILNGVHWTHLVPYPGGSGDGVYSGLQKYVATILARDNALVDVVHGLGTTAVAVAVWDSQGRQIGVSVTRKAGNEANAVVVGFNVFGSPAVDQTFMVNVIG